MHKVLLQLDTSAAPSVFDRVVALDGGADHLLSYGGVTPEAVRDLVHGCIFTRGLKDLHNTAIFIGGADLGSGERILEAVRKTFFGPFQVSVMLDPNGSNTTAAAAVLRLEQVAGDLKGRQAVVIAATGPVGSRAAGLLALAGANVVMTSRHAAHGALAARVTQRFGGSVSETVLGSADDAEAVLQGAELLLNAGPAGVRLVPEAAWRSCSTLRAVVDLNAVPPLGVEGVDATDSGKRYGEVVAYGALGVGSLKMKIHRQAIARLFEQNDIVFDAETIVSLGRDLLATSR